MLIVPLLFIIVGLDLRIFRSLLLFFEDSCTLLLFTSPPLLNNHCQPGWTFQFMCAPLMTLILQSLLVISLESSFVFYGINALVIFILINCLICINMLTVFLQCLLPLHWIIALFVQKPNYIKWLMGLHPHDGPLAVFKVFQSILVLWFSTLKCQSSSTVNGVEWGTCYCLIVDHFSGMLHGAVF